MLLKSSLTPCIWTLRFLLHRKLEAIYLLAMTDYITNKNNIDNCTKYQTIRQYKPDRLIYPADVELEAKLDKNDNSKERALKNAIPEFLSFNIVEGGEI